MTHDDEREHIARMAAMLDESATEHRLIQSAKEALSMARDDISLSRPCLTHPSPLHVSTRIMDALRDAGINSWAAAEAVRAGCARAAAEHAAAQKEAR